MKLSPLALSFAAVSLSGLAAAEPHPSLPQLVVPQGLGVNIHFTDPKPGEIEQLAAAGFRWVRMDFFWGSIERERGKYDFSAYERLLAALDAHGIHPVFILDYGNKLYESGGGSILTEEGRAAFAKWAAAATTHFKGRGILWEIWNEPNGGFWPPKADVDQYAAAALAASKAIHEATPDEPIIGPATSGIDMKFLEGCFKAGLLTYWSAVSVHPYRQEAPETAEPEYHSLRRLIAQYAPKDKVIPILSGEWGYSSAWNNFDPIKQGKYLPREWLTNLTNGVPVSIWYDWHDDGKDPKEQEHHFGTTENEYHAGRDPVYDPKPAYVAARTLISQLDGFRFSRRVATSRPDDFALLFTKGEELRVVAWTTLSEAHTIKVAADPGKFDVTSHLGEKQPSIESLTGFLNIPVSDSPTYLSAEKPNPKLASAPEAHPLRAVLSPESANSLAVRVENLPESAFHGTLRLVQTQGVEATTSSQPVDFTDGEIEKTVAFPLKTPAQGEFTAGFQIENASGVAYASPVLRYRLLSPDILTHAKVVADGDAKVASEQTLSTEPPPEPLPGSKEPALKITYHFDAGWKFLRVTPPHADAPIEGQPTAFGFWVFGDGKGGAPRLRVADSTHQMWQVGSEPIKWTGWRYIQFDLTSSTTHWGGAKDSTIHFPIEWDSSFLLDNAGRKQVEGAIYVTNPVLIYPASSGRAHAE